MEGRGQNWDWSPFPYIHFVLMPSITTRLTLIIRTWWKILGTIEHEMVGANQHCQTHNQQKCCSDHGHRMRMNLSNGTTTKIIFQSWRTMEPFWFLPNSRCNWLTLLQYARVATQSVEVCQQTNCVIYCSMNWEVQTDRFRQWTVNSLIYVINKYINLVCRENIKFSSYDWWITSDLLSESSLQVACVCVVVIRVV